MRYAKQTLERMATAEADGFEIIENRNWQPLKKWAGRIVIKICQTNDRMRGFPKRVIWGVK